MIFTENNGNLPQCRIRQTHSFYTGFPFDRTHQTFIVRHGIVQSRFIHSHMDNIQTVFQGNSCCFHIGFCLIKYGNLLFGTQICDFHPAPVSGCNVGYLYLHITCQLAHTCQSPTFCILFIGDVTGLWRIHFTCHQLHLAFTTGSIAGTGGIDSHIRFSRYF